MVVHPLVDDGGTRLSFRVRIGSGTGRLLLQSGVPLGVPLGLAQYHQAAECGNHAVQLRLGPVQVELDRVVVDGLNAGQGIPPEELVGRAKALLAGDHLDAV